MASNPRPLSASPVHSERPEPSLARSTGPRARLVGEPEGPSRIELRAGERAAVASTLTERPGPATGFVAKAGFAALIGLALVGVASLVRSFVGL